MLMPLSFYTLVIKSTKSLKINEKENTLKKNYINWIQVPFAEPFLTTAAEISLHPAALPLPPSHNHRKDFLATIIMRGRCYNTVRDTHTQSRTPSPTRRGSLKLSAWASPSFSLAVWREGKGERVEGGRERGGGRPPSPSVLTLSPSLSPPGSPSCLLH